MCYRQSLGVFFMQLKVIDKDKVKILIERKDIEENLISFESIDSQQKASREFILMLLKETYMRTGLNFLNSKILIEALPGTADSFYVIITRISAPLENSVELDTTLKADEDMYLFKLNNAENIFDIIETAKIFENIEISRSKLYKYKDCFYLAVYFPPKTVAAAEFDKLISGICKFSQKCKWTLYNEPVLFEWGEILWDEPLKNKAVQKI